MKIIKLKDDNEVINYIYTDTIYKYQSIEKGRTKIFCNFPEGEMSYSIEMEAETLIKNIHKDDILEIIDAVNTLPPPKPPLRLEDLDA